MPQALPTSRGQSPGVKKLLLLLFATGWAANHFAALIPVLHESGRYPSGSLEAAFGLYALGLLPSLLTGGALADRFHPRPLIVVGALAAAVGNLFILLSSGPLGTSLARFLVGLGVGISISAGNAWMARIRPNGGPTLAGTIITTGFAVGPLLGGLISELLPDSMNLAAPILTTVALSSITAMLVASIQVADSAGAELHGIDGSAAHPPARLLESLRPVLWRAIPMALWVFSCVTVPVVVLVTRMTDEFSGPVPAGLLSFTALGSGAITQIIARRRRWGFGSGPVGLVVAAAGFTVAAFFSDPATPALALGCAVLLGIAYGLNLRNGLMDIEALAPKSRRGLVGGIFYVATYTGFAVPYLLTTLEPVAGGTLPLLTLGALSLATAALRITQLRKASIPGRAPHNREIRAS